jgi:hypothetical protein
MKQFIILFLALLASNIFAQDVIIYTNGTEENSKVLEVSETEIRFKKWTNQSGPTYVKKVAEIFMIRYENGTTQTFTIQKQQSEPSTQHSTYNSYPATTPYYSRNTVRKNKQINTPPEGPWLLYGVKVQEGINVHWVNFLEESFSFSAWRFLPSIETYVEFAPKQKNMQTNRYAVYLGLQYSFRGGTAFQGVKYAPAYINLDYLCIRPAYSYKQQKSYAHLGLELGILTNSKYLDMNTPKKSNRESSNAATFGLWMDMGGIIKEHFTIGGYFNFTLTNLVKSEYWRVGNATDGYYTADIWSPNISFGISLGWQFNPVKLDEIKKK